MGVILQTSFRLTVIGWGCTSPNGSMPSTLLLLHLPLLDRINPLTNVSLQVLARMDVLVQRLINLWHVRWACPFAE